MIDIQDHIRNRGLLNLFDGRSVQKAKTYDSDASGHVWQSPWVSVSTATVDPNATVSFELPESFRRLKVTWTAMSHAPET